jgi:hypothetical protein
MLTYADPQVCSLPRQVSRCRGRSLSSTPKRVLPPQVSSLLHASYTPRTRLLHAYYTPLTRLLHASYTPLTDPSRVRVERVAGASFGTPTVPLTPSYTPLTRLLHASYTPLTDPSRVRVEIVAGASFGTPTVISKSNGADDMFTKTLSAATGEGRVRGV